MASASRRAILVSMGTIANFKNRSAPCHVPAGQFAHWTPIGMSSRSRLANADVRINFASMYGDFPYMVATLLNGLLRSVAAQ